MPERNSWRPGRWLVIDDESGLTHYSDEVVRLWDGTYRRIDQHETRHPQEFIKAKSDPVPVPYVRPDVVSSAASLLQPLYVGVTSVRTPSGAASHLYDPGIGEMEVGDTFIVR